MDAILYWNLVTLQACANDYDVAVTAVPEQVGPTMTVRALSIIHGAMFEAVAAFDSTLKSVFKPNNLPDLDGVPKRSGTDAAIMEAAYQSLCALYPKQRPIFDAVRSDFLKRIRSTSDSSYGLQKGIAVGQLIARFILNQRQNDGSQTNTVYTPINQPGYHRVDPLHPGQGFLGASWGSVKPFFLQTGSQFRPPNNLGMTAEARLTYLNSSSYVENYEEVESLGSQISSARTDDQEEIGIAWAYDGAPKLGTPPRLYNQIVRVVAIKLKNTLVENARLFALINYAMVDASIAAWDAKYLYSLWRPIVGIRNAVGATTPDPNWTPLGSQSDGRGTDFTPNFPAYVSGHSAFGSACFEMLRLFYRRDDVRFEFQSDEYNGRTIDSRSGKARPARTRWYSSFTEAETENGISRIYLGVHWRIDVDDGKFIGENIAKLVFNAFSRRLMYYTIEDVQQCSSDGRPSRSWFVSRFFFWRCPDPFMVETLMCVAFRP